MFYFKMFTAMFQDMWSSKVAIQGWSGPCTQPWPLLVLPQQHFEHSNNFSFCKNKNIFKNPSKSSNHWTLSWFVSDFGPIHPIFIPWFLVILPIKKNKHIPNTSATCCLRSCSRLNEVGNSWIFHQGTIECWFIEGRVYLLVNSHILPWKDPPCY